MRYLLFFLVSSLFSTAFAQLTPLVNEDFKKLTIPGGQSYHSLATEEADYPDWTFNTCYAVRNEGKSWLQIGARSKAGSLVTPPLWGLSGNARICAQVYGRDDHTRVKISVDGCDSVLKQKDLSEKEKWYRLNPVLLRDSDGTESSRIKFTCEAQEGSDIKNMLIANVQVYDMGDCLYYETFDRNEGTGGNDGRFAFPTGAKALGSSAFDYIGSDPSKVYPAKGCIAFGEEEGNYMSAAIPAAGELRLLFRIAGVAGKESSLKLSFSGIDQEYDIPFHEGRWKDVLYRTPELADTSRITFTGKNCFIDDVRVRRKATKFFTFSEASENTKILKDSIGQPSDVTLIRTLKADIWNTLCLPFNFDVNMIISKFLDSKPDIEVDLRRLFSVEDGVFTFVPARYVPAGEPFLLRVNTTVENPVLRNVVIRTTTPKTIASTDGNYGFAGALTKTSLPTDGSRLFLGTNGNLYRPSATGNTLKGLRAYFIVPVGANARVAFMDDEEEVASIRTAAVAEAPHAEGRLFNLMGQQVRSGKGLLIKDGKKYLSR